MARSLARHRALPLAAFALVTAAVFGQALFPPSGTLLFGDDIHRYFSFLYEFANRAIRNGELPWWNPYILGGIPFLESPKVALLYPPNWLLSLAPTPLAFSWYVAFHVWLAMTAMYWFLRQWTAKIPAWIAGVAYGLSGFFMARVWAGHIDMIATAAVAPFAFRLFWQAVSARGSGGVRRIVYAAIGIALLYISGYQIIAFFFYEAMVIAAIVVSIFRKSIHPVLTGITALVFGLGFAAVQFLPNIVLLFHSVRTFPFPYSWSAIGALTPQYLTELMYPFLYGDQWTYFGAWQFYHERAAFVGQATVVIALAVVLWAFIRRLRKPEVWALTAIALFGLWMAMANNAPVDLLAILRNIIPTYRTIRIPSRHLVLFVFGTSALAGLGIGMIRNRIIQGVIGLLIVFELIPFARHFISLQPIPTASYDRELLARYTEDGSLFRVLPNFNVGHYLRNMLDFDSGMAYGYFSATGYETGMLRNYYEFVDAANMRDAPSFTIHDVQVPYLTYRAFTQGYADFLNIRYVLVPSNLDPIGNALPDRVTLVRDDESAGYRLYENTQYLPRFFFVPNATILPSRQDVARAIRTGANLTEAVLVPASESVEKPLMPCASGVSGSVRVISYDINRIILSVNTRCDAYLISSDVMYPGWKATVDGKTARLFEGNLAFRSMIVPQGNHTVVMSYRPVVFYYGSIVSAVCLVSAWYFVRKKKS